jgi:hypothetical protein
MGRGILKGLLDSLERAMKELPDNRKGSNALASEKIHCEHCLSVTKKEKTAYYHSMMAATVVKPGSGLEYRYKWVNGIENRADGERLLVNYLCFEIWNEEKGEVTYKNSWITDKKTDKNNVQQLAECARTRWKIENEHNNVLKRRGYNLEHNFGHGKNHAGEIYCLLNLMSFLFHGIQDLADEDYQKARGSFGRRDAFFWALRYEMSRYLHEDWHDFLLTVAAETPDG